MSSPIKVAINEGGFAFASDSINIFMGLRFQDGGEVRVLRIGDGGRSQFETIPALAATDPTMIIPKDFALVLLEELLRHFQGASDLHTVRSDYLHERGRVDKMLEQFMSLSRQALDKIPDGPDA